MARIESWATGFQFRQQHRNVWKNYLPKIPESGIFPDRTNAGKIRLTMDQESNLLAQFCEAIDESEPVRLRMIGGGKHGRQRI